LYKPSQWEGLNFNAPPPLTASTFFNQFSQVTYLLSCDSLKMHLKINLMTMSENWARD